MHAQGPGAGLQVRFTRTAVRLRARVTGDSSFENTVSYWRAIVAELHREPARELLLIDELQGEPLAETQWLNLVEEMRGHDLEEIRIAHVKPHGLQQIEYCEIFAREAGFVARVFDTEHAAEIWLRYGET